MNKDKEGMAGRQGKRYNRTQLIPFATLQDRIRKKSQMG